MPQSAWVSAFRSPGGGAELSGIALENFVSRVFFAVGLASSG